jgi:DNA-directed RNA polymerase subunit RPC12/RpoP
MSHTKKQCEMCDRAVEIHTLSLRGWCVLCESEFEQLKEDRSYSCKECATPISCTIAKKCYQKVVANERQPERIYLGVSR